MSNLKALKQTELDGWMDGLVYARVRQVSKITPIMCYCSESGLLGQPKAPVLDCINYH